MPRRESNPPRRRRSQQVGNAGSSGSGSSSSSAAGVQAASLRAARPWGNFAKKYFDAGWCPLPLPPRRKSSPPTGTTGKYDMPDKKKIMGWHNTRDPRGNIAVRMPNDVIGIDVDAYLDKVGRASLAELEADLGELPATWTLTSRRDGVSGIRFFRVTPGLHWPGEPLADVQIVQHHHRYAVAYPSIHPDTKATYLWYAPGDDLLGQPSVTIEREIPSIDDIARLPPSWEEGLTGGRQWRGLAADDTATSRDILDWIKARPAGEPCRLMRKQAEAAVAEIGVGGAHDVVNARVYSMVSLGTEGHSGLSRALRKTRDAFIAEVTRAGRKGRRTPKEASDEFSRARDGAIRIMMASVADGESVLEDECGCSGSSLNWGEKLGVVVAEDASESGSTARRVRLGKAKSPDKYTFDDSGNAEHMLDILDGSAHWVAGEKCWFFWNTAAGAWQPDISGSHAMQAAQLVGKRCRELSDELTERLVAQGSSVTLDAGGDTAKKIAQLDKHAKVSSDHKGLTAMIKVAAAQSRAEKPAEDFDANPVLLACPNGTIELGDRGVRFLKTSREHFLSISTGTEYIEHADSWAWNEYLDRFLPDPEIRRYVQKIAGYSLFGGNPERKMFFLHGDTSTGKSTFGKVLSGAIGKHAGAMNLSLFRDSQDEKPRPDMVRALSRRLLVAYETSQEWHLHGDQIKRLTGGDPIKARLLHSSIYVDRKPAFTPWVVTNSMPQIHGSDRALARRLVRVPFDQVVEEGKEDFRIEIELASSAGRSAVLAWAVRGWELYRRTEGGLKAPEAVLRSTEEMLAELTDIDVFLSLHTQKRIGSSTAYVVFSELFDRWRMWAADNNVDDSKMSSNKFGRELTGRGYVSEARKVRGETLRVRTGLVWKK